MKHLFRFPRFSSVREQPLVSDPVAPVEPSYPQVDPPAPPLRPVGPDMPPEPSAPVDEPAPVDDSAPLTEPDARIEAPAPFDAPQPDILSPNDVPAAEPAAPETVVIPPEPSPRVLSQAEEAEYREFLRTKREAEIALLLRRLVIDLSGESDRFALKAGVESAVRLSAAGVLVSPMQVVLVKKLLKKSGPRLMALVGGTGESLPSVKKLEAKRALRQGAEEIVLTVSVYSLKNGAAQNVRRELRTVRRAARRAVFSAALFDRRLSREEVLFGVREAAAAGADGAFLAAEAEVVEAASECGLSLGAARAENAEQLKLLVKAGAGRVLTMQAERIAEELRLQSERQERGA